MDWKHVLIWVFILLVGFYIGKKYPGTFSGIPGLNAVL